MNERDFQNKLTELLGEIGEMPAGEREKLEQLATETKDRHDKMKKTMRERQESLDYLRLSVKYLVFDLEATRRENDYLRGLVTGQNDDGSADGAD